jgi:hypothetical protein
VKWDDADGDGTMVRISRGDDHGFMATDSGMSFADFMLLLWYRGRAHYVAPETIVRVVVALEVEEKAVPAVVDEGTGVATADAAAVPAPTAADAAGSAAPSRSTSSTDDAGAGSATSADSSAASAAASTAAVDGAVAGDAAGAATERPDAARSVTRSHRVTLECAVAPVGERYVRTITPLTGWRIVDVNDAFESSHLSFCPVTHTALRRASKAGQ